MAPKKMFLIGVVIFALVSLGTIAAGEEKPGISTDLEIQMDEAVGPLETTASPLRAESVDENGLICDVITFEGLGNNQPIGTVEGRVNVIFGSSWLGLVDIDAGGGGNFANEPSPSTAAYFLDQNDISIRLSAGIQIIEFQYSAAAQSLPVHVIAYDEADNLVDDNTSSVVGTDYDGASCSGDPNGNFCGWATLTLSSTSNNIRRIEILGTVSNYFGIDNLKLCTGSCVPPEGQDGVWEKITDFTDCPPLGPKTPRWGRFGKLPALEADSGERLEVECGDFETGIAAYFLYYTPPGGTRMKVGMCPFKGGCNSTSFYHAGDNDDNGKPDCFISTRWISKDYSQNDKPNAWTGERDFPLENVWPPYTHLLDWAESSYEVNTNSLTKIDRKYEYKYGPPVEGCADLSTAPEGDLFEEEPVTSTALDPPLGPETEAFFDSVLQRLPDVPPDLAPMSEDSVSPCDFDRNGLCDEEDRAKLRAHIGSCDGEPGYHPLADADGNGCLTVADEAALFGRGEPPVADAGPDQTVAVGPDCTASVTLDGSGSSDPDGDPLTYSWTWVGGSAAGVSPTINLPLSTSTITLVVNDGTVDSDPDTVDITVVDTTPPGVEVKFPVSGTALQDGVTLTAEASDACGVAEVYFCVREPDGASGIPIGFEDLAGTFNGSSGYWEHDFDTTQLPDGYYVVIAKATDTNDNEGWSQLVSCSIRNWAVIELLPASEKNKAGRTMPVKFALRIAAAVDPAQPFVYNEELEIKIYDASEPGTILQTSLYGDTSTDYRINTDAELYITNFKTMKKPATYVVEIWRSSKNFLVGSFTFETVK